MHNNSPRMGIPLESPTPGQVGPTTYIICDGRQKLKNVTPFLSTDDRTASFFTKSFCDTLYSSDTSDVKFGSSPRNRAKRFLSIDNSTPGPVPEELKGPKVISPMIGRGKLYLCRTPYSAKCTGPSVPTQRNANGYYLNEQGDVTPIPIETSDVTLGPAFYKIHEGTANDQYKGCKWSKRTTKRESYRKNDCPGPADYNVKIPASCCSRNSENDEFREMARLLSFVPRFLDAEEMRLKKENLPGPADYNFSRSDLCRRCTAINSRPFITANARFKNVINDTPSPAAYNLVKNQRNVSKTGTPFLVEAARFPRRNVYTTPGPGEYHIEGQISKKLRKKSEYAAFGAPFNNSAGRIMPALNGDLVENPSPFDYTVDGAEKKCKIFVSGVFKSKVKRFPKKCGKMAELSPAHYNPIEAFHYIKNQHSYNTRKLPFNTVDRKRGMMDCLNFENPSPANYLSQSEIGTKGALIPVSSRFPEDKKKTPGPGTYWIHPYHDTSVRKAFTTHNLKIKENILRSKLRYASRETREKWLSSLGKRPHLRWFVNEGKGYVHC